MAGAQGVRAGRAYVEIGANDSALNKALAGAQQRLESFGRSVLKAGAGISAIGAVGLTPILAMASSFAAAGSELNDMSIRTGASVESLSALSYAAKQTGTDISAVETGIKKAQKAIVDAGNGSKEAAAHLAALGLSAQELQGLSPDQQFQKIAEAVGKIEDPTQRAAAAMGIFGKSGTDLIPLTTELGQLTEQAQRLGLVMSTEDAKAADALGDSMDTLHAEAGALANQIGAVLAPTLISFAQSATNAIVQIRAWIANHEEAIITVAKWTAGMVAAGTAIAAVGSAILIVTKVTAAIGAVFTIARTAALALATANAALAATNYAVAASSATAQAITGVGVVKVLAGIAAAGAAAGAIAHLAGKYGDLKEAINGVVGAQGDVNTSLNQTASTGTAGPVGPTDNGRATNESLRALHEQRLQNIENENERELNLAIARGEAEIARAREAGANDETLWAMRQTLAERLGQIERDQVKKTADEKKRQQDEIEERERQRIQRIADANQERADQNAALELEASGKTGTELARARLALEKQIELRKAAAAGEDLRAVEREYDLKNKILDQQDKQAKANEAMRAAQEALSKIDAVGQFGGSNIQLSIGGKESTGKELKESNRLLKKIEKNTKTGVVFG